MKKLYLNELIKILKSKSFVIVTAVMLGACLVLYLFSDTLTDSKPKGTEVYATQDWIVSIEAERDYLISLRGTNMTNVEKQRLENRIQDATYAIELVEYLCDNQVKLYARLENSGFAFSGVLYVEGITLAKSVEFDLGGVMIGIASAHNSELVDVELPFVLLLFIYGVALAIFVFTNELVGGTVKLVFLKPISRKKFAIVKLMAAATLMCGFWLGFTLISVLGSLPLGCTDLFVVWGGEGVLLNGVLARLLLCMNALLSALCLLLLACFAAVLTKSRILTVLIPLFLIGFSGEISESFPNFVYFDVNCFMLLFRGYGLGIGVYGASNIFVSLFSVLAFFALFFFSTLKLLERFDYDKAAVKRETA